MTVLLIEPVVVRYGDDPQLCRGQYYLSGIAAEMVSEYCGLSGEQKIGNTAERESVHEVYMIVITAHEKEDSV